MRVLVRLAFLALVVAALSVCVVAAKPTAVETGNTAPPTKCTKMNDIPGGEHWHCDVWAPVEPNNLASYDPPFQPQWDQTFCSDAKRQVCGCIVKGTFTLQIPNPTVPGSEGIVINVNGSIKGIVSGKGLLTVSQGANSVATGDNGYPQTPATPKGPNVVLNAGANQFSFNNQVNGKDAPVDSAESCIWFSYDYDLLKGAVGAEYNDTLCHNMGGVWLAGAEVGHKCCGADTTVGGDFMSVVDVHTPDSTDVTQALCVKTQDGTWKWISKDIPGQVIPIKFDYKDEGGASKVYQYATAVYTDDGPRYCGPDVDEKGLTGNTGDPQLLSSELSSCPPSGSNSGWGNTGQTINHGYLCVHDEVNDQYPMAECTGKDTHTKACTQDANMKPWVSDIGANATFAGDDSTYYCTATGTWLTEVDDEETCAAANLVWTGSRCCGFGPGQYYNDVSTLVAGDTPTSPKKWEYDPAGCWNSTTIFGTGTEKSDNARIVGTTVADPAFRLPGKGVSSWPTAVTNNPVLMNRSILNFNGTFQACLLPDITVPLLGALHHPYLDIHWCEAGRRQCGDDKGLDTGKVYEMDSTCHFKLALACAYGCQATETGANCKTSISCNSDNTAVVTTTSLGKTVTKKCPDNKPICDKGVCEAKPPASGFDTKEFNGLIKQTSRNSCGVALIDSGDTKLDWPDTDVTKCWNTKTTPATMNLKTNNKLCYPIIQKNLYNTPVPRGTRVDTMKRCVDWLLQPSDSTKQILTKATKGVAATGTPTPPRGKAWLDVSKNDWATKGWDALAKECECGIVFTKMPSAKDPHFTIECQVKREGQDCTACNAVLLVRCYNGTDHVTALQGKCPAGYPEEPVVFGYASSQPGTGLVPLYQTKPSANDFMSSISPDKETPPQSKNTIIAYISSSADPSRATRALNRCIVPASGDHFDSPDPACEVGGGGHTDAGILGYVWTDSCPAPAGNTGTTPAPSPGTPLPPVTQGSNPILPGGPLLVNHAACDVLDKTTVQTTTPAYWCNANGEWIAGGGSAGGTTYTQLSPNKQQCTVPVEFGLSGPDITQMGCCDPGQCWNGTTAIDNQSMNTAYHPLVNLTDSRTFRCIDGAWQTISAKTTWDDRQLGFCPETTSIKRCLVTPGLPTHGGNPATDAHIQNMDHPEFGHDTAKAPSCIKAGQYIDDHLCDEKGNWTTRTKYLALTMLALQGSLPGTSYSIFCDSPDNVFGQDQAATLDSYSKCNAQNNNCAANNVCLLRKGDVSLIGISLNAPIGGQDAIPSFVKVVNANLPDDVCNYVLDGPQFTRCGKAGFDTTIYYNKDLNVVIYAPTLTQPSVAVQNAIASVNTALLNQKSFIIKNSPTVTTGGVTSDFTFFGKVNNINVLYAAKNGPTELYGFVENSIAMAPGTDSPTQQFMDAIGIHYISGSGTSFNICNFVSSYQQEGTSPILCGPALPSADVVITQERGADKSKAIEAWRDLTAKLRP